MSDSPAPASPAPTPTTEQQQNAGGKTAKSEPAAPSQPQEPKLKGESPLRTAYIAERNEPGVSTGRVVTLDERIIIDVAYTDQPEVRWYCDNCKAGHQVTAQFRIPGANVHDLQHITLCATCLQNALNGIAHSYANPMLFDMGSSR